MSINDLEKLRGDAMSRPLTPQEVQRLTAMHYHGVPVFPAGAAYFSDRFSPPDGFGRLSQGHVDELLKLTREGTPVFDTSDLTERVGDDTVFIRPSLRHGWLIQGIVKANGWPLQFRPATKKEANVLYCDEWSNYAKT